MAQTGYTPILIYSSSTAAAAPAAGSLTNSTLGSELAINITDGKLFYKDNANAIQVIGWKVVPATAGGTGQTSYAVGDILYANTTTSLAKLADVATGNALISGGVGVAPAWGKVGLTTHVSGTLPTANGGTNLTSFTANGVVYASSTSALTTSTALQFNGTSLGLNLTPNAWADGRAVEIGTSGNAIWGVAAANDIRILSNAFWNGTNYKYANNGFANMFSIGDQVGEFNWYTAPSGTAGNNISGANAFGKLLALKPNFNLEITSGNLVIGTSGKGIDFSANSHAAGMTSELLTWYEEGTWTPVVTSGGGTITSYTSAGNYTRVGNVLTIFMRTKITNPGTASGNLNFSGLPFTAKTVGIAYITLVTARENNLTGANYSALIAQSATTGLIVNPSWTTNVEYLFSATYLL